jgi:hypothetical protein
MAKQEPRIPADHILRKYNIQFAGKGDEWYLPSKLHGGLVVAVHGLPQLCGRLVARSRAGLALLVNEYEQPMIVHTDSLPLPKLF